MPELHQFSDEAQTTIINRLEMIAEYEPGDIVTVEPHDGPQHSVSHLESVPLVIDEVLPRNQIYTHKDPSWYHEYDPDRVLTVPVPDSWNRDTDTIELYLSTPEYSFKRNRFGGHDELIQPRISEHSLISWDDYDGPISLTTNWDNRKEYTDKLTDSDTPCPICESQRRRITETRYCVGSDGSKSCAVCGYIFEEHHRQ